MSMKQVISGVNGVQGCMILLFIRHNGCTDSDEITVAILVRPLVAHVTLLSAGSTVCRTAEQNGTNLGCIVIYINK